MYRVCLEDVEREIDAYRSSGYYVTKEKRSDNGAFSVWRVYVDEKSMRRGDRPIDMIECPVGVKTVEWIPDISNPDRFLKPNITFRRTKRHG